MEKFNPNWMNDPKVMKEVIREQMIEYGQVIKEQAEKIERYEKALKEIEMIGSIGSKYQSLEAQLAIEALKELKK